MRPYSAVILSGAQRSEGSFSPSMRLRVGRDLARPGWFDLNCLDPQRRSFAALCSAQDDNACSRPSPPLDVLVEEGQHLRADAGGAGPGTVAEQVVLAPGRDEGDVLACR